MEYGEIGDWRPMVVGRILRGDVLSIVRALIGKRLNIRQIVWACSVALRAHARLLIARLLRQHEVRRALEVRLQGLYKAPAVRRPL